MSTEAMIAMLARQAGPVGPAGDTRRLMAGLPVALPLMAAAVWAVLGLVPPDLWGASSTGPKLGYALALAGAGLWLMWRQGRPGQSIRAPALMLAGVLALALLAGAADLARLSADLWPMQATGKSAMRCPVAIVALSLPALAVALAAMRALAPTHLVRAGLAAGLVAGGLGAACYALACDEGALAFVAIWYTLGMVLSGALGALVGPRVLRW